MLDVTTLTASDFKSQFTRGFPYLPTWAGTNIYFALDVVYYSPNGRFYQCQTNGISTDPTVDTANWVVYNDKTVNYILDADITNAFAEAQQVFNDGLFDGDNSLKLGYLYLSAHFLCMDIRTSKQGVQSIGEQIVSSRSVGSVSESYDIPQRFKDDPVLNFYTKTGYGLKYLNMILPSLVGNISIAGGATQA